MPNIIGGGGAEHTLRAPVNDPNQIVAFRSFMRYGPGIVASREHFQRLLSRKCN